MTVGSVLRRPEASWSNTNFRHYPILSKNTRLWIYVMVGSRTYGEEMAKTVIIEKQVFEAMLSKMINAKPVPLAKIPKSKKNLSRIRKKAA